MAVSAAIARLFGGFHQSLSHFYCDSGFGTFLQLSRNSGNRVIVD